MNKRIHKKTLASTNQYLTEWVKQYERDSLADKLPPFSVVFTDYQTKGRGQQQHTWESKRGKNLLMSIILYPKIQPSQQFLISQQVSLAIADFLSLSLGLDEVKIKWANDIYIKDKKIAGILVEHTLLNNLLTYSIVGIGLNINQEIFPQWLPNPTSLFLETNRYYTIEDILIQIIDNIKKYHSLDPLDVHHTYLSYLYKHHTFARYKIIQTQEIVELKIINVNPCGTLQTQDIKGKNYSFNFHEIEYLIE